MILFGSTARGEARADSDVDLLLVLPDESDQGEALRRAQKALLPRTVPLDLVAMHQSHWNEGASMLARTASREGVTLYAE